MANQEKEYWKTKLVAKNIPDHWSSDLIQNFLEVVTGKEVVEDSVEYFEGIKHTALVTFTDSLTEECIEKAQQQVKRKGKTVTLELIRDPPTSILVRDLNPALTQDNLFYYFDSQRSGGSEGEVLEDGCQLFANLRLAIVAFSSPAVVGSVLAVQEHQPCRDIKVQVEPCYNEFHVPLIQQLSKKTTTGSSGGQGHAAEQPHFEQHVQHAQSAPSLSHGPQRGFPGVRPQMAPSVPPKPRFRPSVSQEWEHGASLDEPHEERASALKRNQVSRSHTSRSQSMDCLDPQVYSEGYLDDYDCYEPEQRRPPDQEYNESRRSPPARQPYGNDGRGHNRFWRGTKGPQKPFTIFPPRPSSGFDADDGEPDFSHHRRGKRPYRGRGRGRGRHPSPWRSPRGKGQGNYEYQQYDHQTCKGRGGSRKKQGYTSRAAETDDLFCFDTAYGDGGCGGVHSEQPPPARPHRVIRLDADCNPLPPDPFSQEDCQSPDTDGGDFGRRISESDLSLVSEYEGYTYTHPKKTSLPGKDKKRFYLHSDSGEYPEDSYVSDDGGPDAMPAVPPKPGRTHANAARRESAKDADSVQKTSTRERELQEELQRLKMEKEQLQSEKELAEKEREELKQQKMTMEHMPVQPYQLQVLKQFAADFQLCQVTLLEQEGAIMFHGTEENCANAKCIFLTHIQELAQDQRNVPAVITTVLKTKQGQLYLNGLYQMYPQCAVDVQDSRVVCAGQAMKDVSNLLEDIKRNIRQETCQVPNSIMSSPELLALKAHLESELLVLLTLQLGQIIVDGINGDVDMAMRELGNHVSSNKPGRKAFHIPGVLAGEAIKQWYPTQLDEVKGLILKNGEMISEESSQAGYKLTYQCHREVLQDVQDRLKKIMSGIFCFNPIDLQAVFTSYSERALVINGLHSYGVEGFCVNLKQTLLQNGIRSLVNILLPQKCQLPKQRYTPKQSRAGKHHSQSKPSIRPSAAPPLSRPRRTSSAQFHPYTTTIGNTTVTIKTGDISKENVQVIVNIVGEDLQMNGTAVGSAILKRFPHTVQDLQDQQAQGRSGCRIITPPSGLRQMMRAQLVLGGRAPSATQIFHAVLKKLSDSDLTANVKQLTLQCLQSAKDLGCTSIAFPPMGVGRKFGFPAGSVASAMVDSIIRFLGIAQGALQNVTFVIYDMDTAKRFKVALMQRVPQSAGAARLAPVLDDYESDDDDDDDGTYVDDDYSFNDVPASGGGGHSSSNDDDDDELSFADDDDARALDLQQTGHASASKNKFEALLCLQDQADQTTTLSLLKKELKSTFLFTETVQDLSTFKKLGTKAMDDIQSAAMKENVVLRVSEKDGKLTACGQKAGVAQVVSLIREKILKYLSQEKKESTARQHKNKVPGLPADTHCIPTYWKICKKGVLRSFKEAVQSMMAHGKLHSVNSEEQKAIEQLIQDTWMGQFVGHGKDGVNLQHRNIKVVKVQRLENPELWERYSMLRETCIRKVEFSKNNGFTAVESLSQSKGPIMTTAALKRGNPLRREIYPLQVNEHYLFHGTKQDYVDAILKEGLDFRISSVNAMLGRGIYASESATKADQYTDDKRQRTPGNKTMLLIRMLLGQPFINKAPNPTKYNRPPCMKCHKDVCTCTSAGRHDSVIDDAGRNFREFVVYDSNMCYPEYFITYQRV